MRRAVPYVLAAFGFGFVLAPVREWVLAPRLGLFAATLAELPVMLAFTWWVAGRLVRGVPPGAPRWRMGLAALAMLLLLEFGVGIALRGWSFGAWVAHFATPPGLASLGGYLLFALWPALRRRQP